MLKPLIGFLALMGVGLTFIVVDQVANADRKPIYERQGWSKIEGPSNCSVYWKTIHGRVLYASTCSSLAVS